MRIGVFDSGVGGLTVLRALLAHLPEADFLYLGDTARLPYGSKSQPTIARYALSSSKFLIDEGAEFLVIACNTASALALSEIRALAASQGVSVVGVIEPGVSAAKAESRTGDALILATSATVHSHAYSTACQAADMRGIEKACPLLVPLVEEGWIDHPVTAQVVRVYLAELATEAAEAGLSADALILGCTHYPLLREVIAEAAAEQWGDAKPKVIDSAEATALAVARMIGVDPDQAGRPPSGAMRFFATDSVERFKTLGSRFLQLPLATPELVDLGG